MKPGRSVASPRSIVSAPAGIALDPPTATMRPSDTTTTPGETTVSPRPSKIRAAFKTIVLGGSAANAVRAHARRDARKGSLRILRRYQDFVAGSVVTEKRRYLS